MQALIGKVQTPFGGANGVNGIHRRYAVIGLVPAEVLRRAGICGSRWTAPPGRADSRQPLAGHLRIVGTLSSLVKITMSEEHHRLPRQILQPIRRLLWLGGGRQACEHKRCNGHQSVRHFHSPILRMRSVSLKNISSNLSTFNRGSLVPSSISFSLRIPSRLAATVVNG